MTLFLTLLLSFCAFVIVIWTFMHLRTPRFRMDRASFIKGLEDAITGQASESEWRALVAIPMRHDPELEKMRLKCLEIEEYESSDSPPYLFTERGLEQLRQIRSKLLINTSDKQSKS
ncbi:hypothetical protein Misp06_03816 [Microbulbifer sp. NBRC 101763]|uniref:hypothetical protein n=1 Tax=unclassified Microbulbifer TaxID=2619833 RepID=UPI0024ACF094|nr:hypothetical protein [Microbulbifer sp. MLAF003]WHI50701.1 hypothetical protein P3339_20065 [Microbulbifer sp. MLAF003]